MYGAETFLRNSIQPITDAFTQSPFNMDRSQITNAVTAFYPSYALLQIPTGILLQVFSAEIAIICPVILSGVCAQLIYICRSYQSLIMIRFLMGLSQTTCFLATLAIIQQYFSLNHVSFYTGIALMVGNLSPLVNIYSKRLLDQYDIWRGPHLILGCIMQFLCLVLFIAFAIDRKSLINNSLKPHFEDGELKTTSNTEPHESQWKLWFFPRSKLMNSEEIQTQSVNKNSESLNLGKISIETQTQTQTPSSLNGNKVSLDGPKKKETQIEIADGTDTDIELSFCQKALAALSNKFTYLFAFIYACQCIPHSVLMQLWLQNYLCVKYKDLLGNDAITIKHIAQVITIFGFVGAAIGSLAFGYAAKRFHATNKDINRQIIMFGFILNAMVLLVIYVPYRYHVFSKGFDLYLCTFLHGLALGTISVIFAGTRQVNDKTKSADFASGLVSSLCIGAVGAFGVIFGKILKYVQHDKTDITESEYNKAFLVIAVLITIGFVCSIFVPKNRN